MSTDLDRDALRAETLRIHARYEREIVEAIGFCPWAQKTREQGALHVEVLLDDRSDVAAVVEAALELERNPACTVGLLVFPLLPLSPQLRGQGSLQPARQSAAVPPAGSLCT